MDKIKRHIYKWGKRSVLSRHFHAKDDSEAIAAWRRNLNEILRAVEVRSLISAR